MEMKKKEVITIVQSMFRKFAKLSALGYEAGLKQLPYEEYRTLPEVRRLHKELYGDADFSSKTDEKI